MRTHLLAPLDTLESADVRAWAASLEAVPVSALVPRSRARIAGVVRAVTYAPQCERPELRARLYDGSAELDLVWVGRRELPGLEPGGRLVVVGMVAAGEPGSERCVMFNPRYELVPGGREST